MSQFIITKEYEGPGTPRYSAAYELHLPAILAVPEETLLSINVDIDGVVTNTLGRLPRIYALAPQLRELEQFDSVALDNLEGYLLAMAHAQALHAFAEDTESLSAPAEMAVQMREVLLADAKALVQRGLLNGKGLERLRGTRGYRNVGFDLVALTGVMRQNWAQIDGRSAIRLEELDRAEALADQLLISVGLRDQTPPEPAESALIRQRAFTLFVRTYDEVRRAITYLRWHHDDADEIAPSIYAGRQRRRTPPEQRDTGTDLPVEPEEGDDVVAAMAALPPAHLPPADLPPQLPVGPEGS